MNVEYEKIIDTHVCPLFSSADPSIRCDALVMLRSIVRYSKSRSNKFVALVEKALQDSDPNVRSHAAWAMKYVSNDSTIEKLQLAFGDSNSQVRREVLSSLIQHLIEVLSEDEEDNDNDNNDDDDDDDNDNDDNDCFDDEALKTRKSQLINVLFRGYTDPNCEVREIVREYMEGLLLD